MQTKGRFKPPDADKLPPSIAYKAESRGEKVHSSAQSNQSKSTQRGDRELLCSIEQSTPSGIDLGLVRQSSEYSVEDDGLSASLASKHVS